MQIFSNGDITKVTNNNPNLTATKTLKSTTQSIQVINNTMYNLLVEGDSQGELLTLPQMTTAPIIVNPNQQITFTMQPATIQAPGQALLNTYVQMYESPAQAEGGIQPLALMPVYSTPVEISGTPTVQLQGTSNVNVENASIPVTGSVNATIENATVPVEGNVNVSGSVTATIDNAQIPVTGQVDVNVQNASLPVSGSVAISSGSVEANITGGTLTVQDGTINVGNAVQTNPLVYLGTLTMNVFDLANAATIAQTLAGAATGYFETIILEGTSQGGYTYNASATAYNRQTSVGSPSLTQSNGVNGQFYASGNLTNRQSFSNVGVTLTAQDSNPATIFQDPMTSNANWATKSGSATFGASGATLNQANTLLTETSTPSLSPQNLTLQAQYVVQNTSVTNSVTTPTNVGQGTSTVNGSFPEGSTVSVTLNTVWISEFVVNTQTVVSTLGLYTVSGGYAMTIGIYDVSGNPITTATPTSVTNGYAQASVTPVTLNPSTNYYFGVTMTSNGMSVGITNTSSTALTVNGSTFTMQNVNKTGSSISNAITSGASQSGSYSLSMLIGVQTKVPLDTSGNGGRKLVRLSNGWIVAVVNNSGGTGLYAYVSKDNGQTWSQLCTMGGVTWNSWAVASSGTMVYVIAVQSSGVSNYFYSFDATTASGTISVKSNPDSGQSSFGSGCSLAFDGNGTLWAVWCSVNSTYPNSTNIRVSSSTNGGSTWASPTQVTKSNVSGYVTSNPTMLISSGNVPYIIWAWNENGTYQIYSASGTSFTTQAVVYSGGSYAQNNPTACVDGNGIISVAWTGLNSSYTAQTQLFYANSSNGGTSWSTAQNLTTSTSRNAAVPSITVDPSNKLYIVLNWGGMCAMVTAVNFSWTAPAQYLTGDSTNNPQTLYQSGVNFSAPLTIFMDTYTNYTLFGGTWTVGSHSSTSVEYWKDSNDYYQLQWLNSNLILNKVVAGTLTQLASTPTTETASSVTMKLVVASNGNITGTMNGATSTTVTATDTSITSGAMGVTGDVNVVVSNAFISGNYIPSDTVTIDIYAT